MLRSEHDSLACADQVSIRDTFRFVLSASDRIALNFVTSFKSWTARSANLGRPTQQILDKRDIDAVSHSEQQKVSQIRLERLLSNQIPCLGYLQFWGWLSCNRILPSPMHFPLLALWITIASRPLQADSCKQFVSWLSTREQLTAAKCAHCSGVGNLMEAC